MFVIILDSAVLVGGEGTYLLTCVGAEILIFGIRYAVQFHSLPKIMSIYGDSVVVLLSLWMGSGISM